MEQLDLIGRTAELARAFGIDFFSVLSRGSQYRVESMMVRLAHTQNYLMLSPAKEQVTSMDSMILEKLECGMIQCTAGRLCHDLSGCVCLPSMHLRMYVKQQALFIAACMSFVCMCICLHVDHHHSSHHPAVIGHALFGSALLVLSLTL